MRTFKGASSAVTAAVAALALAACGPLGNSAAKSGGPGTPAGTPDSAGGAHATATAQVVQALDLVRKSTGRVHSASSEISVRKGTTLATTAKGDIDWSHGLQGELTATVISGTTAQAIRRATGGDTVRIRYLPGAYYANMGPTFAGYMGGKHWIRYGYADLARISGQSAASVQDIQNKNPIDSIDLVLASGDVRQSGAGTVRGVPATHYAGTVNLLALARQQHANLGAADLAHLRDLLHKAGVTTEHVDLWVTADHLPVKVVSSAHTTKGEVETTVYYSHYGVAVHVQAPSPSDYVDFATLTGRPAVKA